MLAGPRPETENVLAVSIVGSPVLKTLTLHTWLVISHPLVISQAFIESALSLHVAFVPSAIYPVLCTPGAPAGWVFRLVNVFRHGHGEFSTSMATKPHDEVGTHAKAASECIETGVVFFYVALWLPLISCILVVTNGYL